MKIVFFTWITSDFKNRIVDYDGFYKSFKRFHPDIDLITFEDNDIAKLFSEKPWLNRCNCKPSFAKLLYNDYDIVVNTDSDFYFFDRCVEILKGDYDVAACANYNAKLNTSLKPGTIDDITINATSEENYIQGGLVASTSKRFWDDYEELNKKIADKLPLFENDVLNHMWYSGNYRTKILDGHVDYRHPEFKQYYNCAGIGRESQYHVRDDKIYLDDKPVRAYHVAHGFVRKRRIRELFNSDVSTWFYNTIGE